MFNYFIHPSNLQKMDNVLKMRMSEGAAGYGIFMMLLELLRDSDNYRTAYDPSVLAWALHEPDITKLAKVCENYGLFEISEDKQICCPWLTAVMSQHEEKRRKLSEAGKRSAAAKAAKAEQPQTIAQQGCNEVSTTLPPPLEGGSNVVGNLIEQNKPNNKNQKKSNPPANPIVEGIEGDLFCEDFIKKVGRMASPVYDQDIHGHVLGKDAGHNPNPLIAAAATFQLSWPQVQVLYVATRSCEIGSAPFMAFMAACKHCQETQFRPKFAFEYFMSRVKDARDL